MEKKQPLQRRSDCPLHAALEVFGDRWSLLIVRDLMLKGRTTFNAFLGAEEAIATNILANRLQRLEAHGIIAKQRDPSDARKGIYCLTAKGIDLAPILIEMIVWGARYAETDALPAAIVEMTEHRDLVLADIRKRWADTAMS